MSTSDSVNVGQESHAKENVPADDGIHTIEKFSAGDCRCGCIPQNICSLFEMAEKRKIYQRKKKEEEEEKIKKAAETSS